MLPQHILQAIQEIFPYAKHRFCVRHIHENIKQIFKGTLYKDFLWKCATTTTEPQFEHLMGQLKDHDSKAHD
jgi:hypothetical protein